MAKKEEGPMALSTTPLTKDYKLNEEVIKKWVDYCIKIGYDGIWQGGIAAEWQWLDEDVKMKAADMYLKANNNRVTMGCGIFGYNPFSCIRQANHAAEAGADFVWFATPKNPATNDEIFQFFKIVHDNTRVPLGIYNPGPGPYMSPPTIAKIAELERVKWMKTVKQENNYIFELYKLGLFKRLKVLPTRSIVTHLLLGAVGCLPQVPRYKTVRAIYDTFKKGDIAGAIKIEAMETITISFLAPRGNTNPEPPPSNMGKDIDGLFIGADMGPSMAPIKDQSAANLKAVADQLKKDGLL